MISHAFVLIALDILLLRTKALIYVIVETRTRKNSQEYVFIVCCVYFLYYFQTFCHMRDGMGAYELVLHLYLYVLGLH